MLKDLNTHKCGMYVHASWSKYGQNASVFFTNFGKFNHFQAKHRESFLHPSKKKHFQLDLFKVLGTSSKHILPNGG